MSFLDTDPRPPCPPGQRFYPDLELMPLGMFICIIWLSISQLIQSTWYSWWQALTVPNAPVYWIMKTIDGWNMNINLVQLLSAEWITFKKFSSIFADIYLIFYTFLSLVADFHFPSITASVLCSARVISVRGKGNQQSHNSTWKMLSLSMTE